MDELLNYLMSMRNQIKIYHWQTHKYARHMASDKLVDELDSLIDKYVESYSGIYKNISLKSKTNILKLENITDNDITKYIESIRIIIVKEIEKVTDTELKNIADEILSSIDKAIYLFRLE